MKWHIGPRVRATIIAFTGVNFSGNRLVVDIFPTGSHQGDEIDGSRLKCIGLIAPVGTRVILCASASDEHWDAVPWRCIQIVEGSTMDTRAGKLGVQVPDIDVLTEPSALAVDPDSLTSYPHVERLADGTGWTFGRRGSTELKCNVRQIRVERIGS